MNTPTPRTRAEVKALLADHVRKLQADRTAAARSAVVAIAAGGSVDKLRLDVAEAALQQLDAVPPVPSAVA